MSALLLIVCRSLPLTPLMRISCWALQEWFVLIDCTFWSFCWFALVPLDSPGDTHLIIYRTLTESQGLIVNHENLFKIRILTSFLRGCAMSLDTKFCINNSVHARWLQNRSLEDDLLCQFVLHIVVTPCPGFPLKSCDNHTLAWFHSCVTCSVFLYFRAQPVRPPW